MMIERVRLKIETGLVRHVLKQFKRQGVTQGDRAWIACFPTNPTEEQVEGELARLDQENNGLLQTEEPS